MDAQNAQSFERDVDRAETRHGGRGPAKVVDAGMGRARTVGLEHIKALTAAHQRAFTPRPDAHALPEPAIDSAVAQQRLHELVTTMLSAVCGELDRLKRDLDETKQTARPLIRTAIDHGVRTGTQMADAAGVDKSTITNIKKSSVPRLKLDDFTLEAKLDAALARWAEVQRRIETAKAHRWLWLRIGAEVGMTGPAMGAAANISRQMVRTELRRPPFSSDDPRLVLIRQTQATPPGIAKDADGDEDIAMRIALHSAVEQDPADASLHFAFAWYLVEHDGWSDIAHRHYEHAAASGVACAANNIAWNLLEDDDLEGAERWYRVAEEKLQHACPNAAGLGDVLLRLGREQEALDAWERAARRGVLLGAQKVARQLHALDDHVQERGWWEQAAHLGDLGAARWLADRLTEEGATAQADALLHDSAHRGDTESAMRLATRRMAQEPEFACHLLEIAARAGHLGAAQLLAILLLPRDPRRALTAGRRARALGDPTPPVMLAVLLSRQRTESALREAAALWVEAAEAGHTTGLRLAGDLYVRTGDRTSARAMYSRAIEEGSIQDAEAAALGLARLKYPYAHDAHRLKLIAEEAGRDGRQRLALAIADALETEGQRTAAIEVLNKALRRSRDSTLRAELRAERTWQQIPYGDIDSEVWVLARARWQIDAQRGSQRAAMYLAQTAHQDNSTADAASTYRLLIGYGQPYHRELADALLADGLVDEAIGALDQGIVAGESDCYALRGTIALRRGHFEEALSWWRQGRSDGDWEAGLLAGQELAKAGRTAEARGALLQVTGEVSCAWSLLGEIELKRDHHLALQHFRRASRSGCIHGAWNLAQALSDLPVRSREQQCEMRDALRMAALGGDLEAALQLAHLTKEETSPEVAPVIYASAVEHPEASDLIAAIDPHHHPDPVRRPRLPMRLRVARQLARLRGPRMDLGA